MANAVVLGGWVLCLAACGMAAETASPAAAKAPSWTDRITPGGELRLRYEAIADDAKANAGGDRYARERGRIGLRLGLDARLGDRLSGGVELGSGSSSPISGMQTMGEGFAKKDIRLTLAYAEYSFLDSAIVHGVRLTGGKMKSPFANSGDLLWDRDVTPEGFALRTLFAMRHADVLANAAWLWVQERSQDADDTTLFGAQLALKARLPMGLAATVGASYYGYQEMAGRDVSDWEGRNNAYGNTTAPGSLTRTAGGTVTNRAWQCEFAPVECFASLEASLAGRPLSLTGQYVVNVEADDRDAGYQVGISYGKTREPGSFTIGYYFAELQADAVPGFLTDSERWGGGTDGRGHKVNARYQFTKHLQAGVSGYLGERGIGREGDHDPATRPTSHALYQADLCAAF